MGFEETDCKRGLQAIRRGDGSFVTATYEALAHLICAYNRADLSNQKPTLKAIHAVMEVLIKMDRLKEGLVLIEALAWPMAHGEIKAALGVKAGHR